MAAAAILKITLPVEPPLWERNFWFVTSNQKLTFVRLSWRLRVVYSWGLQCWSNFRCKSACKSAKSENGSKFWCFLGRRLPKSEFEGSKLTKGTCTNQNTSFELLNVWIGSELRPVGEMRKLKKKIYNRRENKSHKSAIFHHCVEAPLLTNLDQIWRVCRSRQRNYVYQKWF